MLSAAHDLLKDQDVVDHDHSFHRKCNKMSTGAILLANIIPAVVIKLLLPFFPLLIHLRFVVIILSSIIGFVLVASKISLGLVLSGVALTSLSSGMGESTLMPYMSFYAEKNVISAWSSGTGGAGVFASLIYLAFTSYGVSPSKTIFSMIVVPCLMAVVFWLVIDRPVNQPDLGNSSGASSSRLRVIRSIFFIFILPFFLVYVFEYFINQGLSELINFKNTSFTTETQYRIYSLVYQIGVMISRSSVNIVEINNTWLLAILQGVNVVLMTTQAIYMWIGNIWIVIALILWEGLLGGCSYVNTFRRINNEVSESDKEFAMSVTVLGDSSGITLAGFIAIPVHNYICGLPPP